ncbi:uncharacterized protein LOC124940634 [Impatiens glandulifera]|uniref:uncharacterized protein LOC124940634 n=1 Tax=Impatiens glandulifera TaxID=253017 RepID=UPI001FB106CB|nr:uncharacterized protein LOC124940634 [Impatiens glandulifera]
MRKQSISRKPETYGKGNVTSVQIAFIVDRYLSDNNCAKTRSTFRSESPDFISRSPVQEAPKGLLSLASILDEYIKLKEQKLTVDQEKSRLEHERIRIQSLLSGMQDAMKSYSSCGNVPLPSIMPQSNANSVMRMNLLAGSPAVYSSAYPVHRPSNPMLPMPKTQIEQSNMSTQITNQSSKRKICTKNVTDPQVPAKRTRGRRSNKDKSMDLPPRTVNDVVQPLSITQLSNSDNILNGSCVNKPQINKCSESPIPISVPITPRSTANSQTDNSISPVEISSTNCIVIMSPNKQVAYYSIERNHSITASSPDKTNLRVNKRDRVKGRLDFDMDSNILSHDVASTSEPINGEDLGGIFDLDFLENLDLDFSIHDLLLDSDMDTDFSAEPESHSGSPDIDTIGNSENSDLFSGNSN